jgi:hypothetical protein
MRLLLPFAVLLLASAGLAADQKEAADPILPRKGLPKGLPKAANKRAAQLGPPLSNPGDPVARLYRASPEDRERALEKLPFRMQQQFRNRLERFDAMPKPQQQVLIRRAERYASLSVEQKAAFMAHMGALRTLPPDRQREIGLAIRRMQPLSEEERQTLVTGDAFKSRFSPDEQKIVTGLVEVMIPPN